MKTEVYSWRVSPQRKSDLQAAAVLRGKSLGALLEEIAAKWLETQRRGQPDEAAEQERIRARVLATVGKIHGTDPTRSSRASELIRKRLRERHAANRPR